MKQHITVEQLNELSDKGKEKLRDWWKPSWGDCWVKGGSLTWFHIVVNSDEVHKPLKHTTRLPLLSIGQMIEFLVDNKGKNDAHFTLHQLDCHGEEQWSNDSFTCRGNHHSDKSQEFYDAIHKNDREPCNVLWDSVKKVLSKKK